MNPLVLYYRRQAGRGRADIGSIYTTPHFVQRGHGLGSILSGLFRTLTPIIWPGIKTMGTETLRTLGREALRTGGKILTDIAENPQAGTRDIISQHVSDSTQNIIKKLRGGGRKRKRASSSTSRTVKRKRKNKRTLQSSKTIKRDIFS
jgi:hypothetical protein